MLFFSQSHCPLLFSHSNAINSKLNVETKMAISFYNIGTGDFEKLKMWSLFIKLPYIRCLSPSNE